MIPSMAKEPAIRARELKELLIRLGPTFIKFGQMLSTRPDVLPPVYIYQLQTLCDEVPHFDHSLALATIQQELGVAVADVFVGLEAQETPIAAASLGQVYKTQLRSGEWVALKVQRPDMIECVSLDLYLLRQYMKSVEMLKQGLMDMGVMAARNQFDVNLLDTFATASYRELDYVNEGQNQDRMSAELEKAMTLKQFAKIRIPKVHWDLTTRKVLVTEWVEGKQLSASPPEVVETLVATGVDCFMAQLIDIGFFHSDPHPGNMLVDNEGRLVLIDFGLCAEVAKPDSKCMVSALVHLMQADVAGLLHDAQQLGFLPKNMSKQSQQSLLEVLQRIFKAAQLQQMSSESTDKTRFRTAERRKQFRHVSRDLNQVFFEYPFRVPDYFALITRALIVLEGIAVRANPEFDIFQASYPHASKRALSVLGWKDMATITATAVASSSVGTYQDMLEAHMRL